MLLPLFDVLCFLLATFALFLLSANRRLTPRSVEVPGPLEGRACPVETEAHVAVDLHGGLWLDGESIAPDALRDQLSALRTVNPEARVVFAVDEHAPFGVATTWIAECKRLGLGRVRLEAKRL